MPKMMNHSEYMKKTRRMEATALQFTIRDCREAIAANPDGENVGYYLDEISYCAMELKKRGLTTD